MTALQRKKRFLHTLARGNDNMIECDGIVMTGLVRGSAIGGSASNANRQIARSTSNRNNERRVEYGIEIRQWRRRVCGSASCHARESGHPKRFPQALDSRLRACEEMVFSALL
jgi:hypothetical protein